MAVAFGAGNLEPVTKAMRQTFPDLPMVICADDDYRIEGNPGRTKAAAAALAVGGVMVSPVFHGDRPDGATDFNDLHQAEGIDAVRRIIAGVVEVLATRAAEPQPDTETPPAVDADGAATPETATSEIGDAEEDGSDETAPEPPPFPGEDERPCYVVLDDWTEYAGRKYRPGVYLCGMTEAKRDTPAMPFELWFCSPLHVDAVTFDGQDNNFGRLLRFKNTLGRWREWAMPMELLRGAGDELRGELLAMGVEIDPSAKTLLANYLQAKPPKRRMRCALQVGWCDDSFVLPDTVIGPKASGVIFQSGERGHDEHTKAGTLAGWQAEIAARAVGNPCCCWRCRHPSQGRCWRGAMPKAAAFTSSVILRPARPRLIEAACSTWGGPNFRRSWRATANGMEGAAALFNDCLLALDEISECDPKEVGAIVYALGNGRGKQRAGRTGNARGVTRWRCFMLSSGERTIATDDARRRLPGQSRAGGSAAGHSRGTDVRRMGRSCTARRAARRFLMPSSGPRRRITATPGGPFSKS